MQMAGRRSLATVSLATKSPGIAPRGFLRLGTIITFLSKFNIARVPGFVK
nr:MAG TPA: hypothetical protein [Inoviridae sp.]